MIDIIWEIEMTNKIALITGATNGIGLELARIHAQKGGDLVLVARTEQKLTEIQKDFQSRYNITVTIIAADLTEQDAVKNIFQTTQALNLDIDILINNAGFGGHGLFHEQDLENNMAMIELNMSALTSLTHYYLKGMCQRKQGKILNISSVASFMPGPLQAVYYATKAYVTSFSQAIAAEVAKDNITVTAYCPGPVHTGFVVAGDLEGVSAWRGAKSAGSAARCGYKAMEKGQLIAFNETKFKILVNIVAPFLPRKLILMMSRRAMEK